MKLNATSIESIKNKKPTFIKNFTTLDQLYDFNFLMVSQISPRKNMVNAIKWWVEEFIDQEVGLVLKCNFRRNCFIDFEHT